MMQVLFIACILAVASAVPTISPCMTGKKTTYQYVATAAHGIVGTPIDKVALTFKFTIDVTVSDESPKAELKIVETDIMPASQPSLAGKKYKLMQDLQQYTLPFELKDGRVGKLFPHPDEREEILNIKRGVVSMLQVEVAESSGKRIIEETDVLGICMTEVVQSSLDDKTIILKKRDSLKCMDRRPLYTTMDTTMNQEGQFVPGYTTAMFKLNSDRDIVYAEVAQKEMIRPLSTDSEQVVCRMRQTLELVKTSSVDVCADKSAWIRRTERSLMFNYSRSVRPEDSSSVEDVKMRIENMPELHAQDIPEAFLELIQKMRGLNRDEFQMLNETYAKYKKVDAPSSDMKAAKLARDAMAKHSFFLDALAYVGTESSLDLIVDLASGDGGWFLNFTRKVELTWSMAAIPVHSLSPCKVLNYSLELAKLNKTYQVPTLVLGSVLNKVLAMYNYTCENDVSEATEFLLEKLQENIKEIPEKFNLQSRKTKEIKKYWERVVHTIKALGNSGVSKTIKAVRDVLEKKMLQTEARTAAVYALKRVARKHPLEVLDIVMKVFRDKSENEEVRIAAFTIAMEMLHSVHIHIAHKTLRQFVMELIREPNPYVKSYACSYFTAVEKTPDPSLLELRTIVLVYAKPNGLLRNCAVEDKGYSSSRADFGYASLADAPLPKSIPQDVMGIGFSSGILFAPPVSPMAPSNWLPQSASLKLHARAFGYETDLLEFGGRAMGLERLIQQLFGPTGYLRKGTRKMDVSGLLRDPSFIVDIPQENISASGFVKVLGNEIAWNHIEQDEIMRLLYSKSPALYALRDTVTKATFDKFDFSKLREIVYKSLDYVRYLTEGKLPLYHGKINVTKTVRVVDAKRSIATIMGLPLNVTISAAGHMKLDAEGEVCYKNDAPIKSLWSDNCEDRIEAIGQIHPRFSLLSKVEVVLDAYEIQSKLVFRGNVSSDFKQSVKAVLYSNYTANVHLEEMPEDETMLLNASYIQYTETEGIVEMIGIEKRNNTEIYEPISGAGLTLLTNLSYPNSTGIPFAPWFPLSGPANLTVFVRKTSPLLKGLNLTFWNETLLSFDHGYINFSIDAMGIGRKLNASVIWMNDSEKTCFINATIKSLPANFTALINTSSRFGRWLNMTSIMSLNTTISNTTGVTIWNSSYIHFNVSRVRHTEDNSTALLKEPEFNLTMNASLYNSTHGNMSAMLFLEGSDKPQWLRSNFTIRGLMVNITADSSQFDRLEMGYILPLPLKTPVCHVFNGHFITFDSMKFEHGLSDECEHILARHRHPNDTFAVTIQNRDVHVYINRTKYTLTPEGTNLKVNGKFVESPLPYRVKHVMNITKIKQNNQQYIRLTAWAGVDIFYNNGDIQLSINGFYMNQTAGLCGNANYNGTVVDERRKPDFELAPSVFEFVQAWGVGKKQCESKTKVTPEVTPDAVKECSSYFFNILSEGHTDVDPIPFYKACLHDVSRQGSPLQSVRAYVMAAHSVSVDLDGCSYDDWSDWSECKLEDGKWLRSRSRKVLPVNILKNVCPLSEEKQECVNDLCEESKEHIITVFHNKVCKSTRRYPICRKDTQCKPEKAPAAREEEFKCVQDGESLHKLDNASPVLLSFTPTVGCQKQP